MVDNPDLSAGQSEVYQDAPAWGEQSKPHAVYVLAAPQQADAPIDVGGGEMPASELAEPLPIIASQPEAYPTTPLDPSPLATQHAPLDIDWSVGLRGSHVTGTEGTGNLVELTPSVSLAYEGMRWQTNIDAGLSASVSDEQLTRIDALEVGFDTNYALDRNSDVGLTGNLAVAQEDPNAPGVDNNIILTPLEMTGDLTLSAERQMGRFVITGSAGMARTWIGDTFLSGNVTESNTDLSYWAATGSLRVGFEATPILTPFVEASITRATYDEGTTGTGVYLNNSAPEVAIGLLANWQYGFSAEASVGFRHTDFDDVSLADMYGATYALDLGFAPPEGLQLAMNLSTTHNPGDLDAGTGASVDYAIGGSAELAVTDWLALRSSIGAGWSVPEAGGPGEMNFQFGVGADYLMNRYAALALDYEFLSANNFVDPVEYSHRISTGLTVSRPE